MRNKCILGQLCSLHILSTIVACPWRDIPQGFWQGAPEGTASRPVCAAYLVALFLAYVKCGCLICAVARRHDEAETAKLFVH